jgi:energy-coupling factor transporter ATP-binding protein EcfA2
MSTATKTDPQSPALHAADTHDRIRVQGARENNLKNISVEIPKRRLTVFTGVSGSGKSSLVFGTIAAESQRLINETYSAFVQGFMPTLARPDVDLLDGLTTAIIVDQERMGANARSTVGTATDANAMLRILFSRLGKPHIGRPGVLLQRRLDLRRRRGHRRARRHGKTKERRSSTVLGGMCPRCEGMGRLRHRPGRSCTTRPSRSTRAPSRSPATAWTAGTAASSAAAASSTRTSRSASTPRRSCTPAHKEPTKIKVDGINLTYDGPDPADPEVVPVQGRRRHAAAHPRVRRARSSLLATCPECERHPAQRAGPLVEDQGHQHRRRLRDADQRPGRVGPRLDEPSVAPLLASAAGHARLVRRDRPRLPLARPPVRHAVGRRGPAHQDDPPPRLVAHRRHLRVRRADDRPAPARHPADEHPAAPLRDKGNTVLVVEHKPETIAIADHVVDLGPGAGTGGGEICFEGTSRACGQRHAHRPPPRRPRHSKEDRPQADRQAEDPRRQGPQPQERRRRHPARRARRHHRRRRLRQELARARVDPRRDGVVSIDQGAIHGSRRSNPATYTGLLEPIRKAFAKGPTASSPRCSAPTPRAPAPPATAPASSTPTWR